MISPCCSASKLPLLNALVLATLLAGCAGEVSKEKGRYELFATIRIERNLQKPAGDCPVGVTISNRTETAWDGASYHVSLLNKAGKAIGKLIGTPRKQTKAGQELADSGQVLGAKCADIAGVSPIYFGYYPVGKKQVPVHNSHVGTELK